VSRLVLFDLDGTLVDSTPGIWASVRAAAAALGLPGPTPAQLRAMVGPPLQDGFAQVLGLVPADAERAVAAYRAHHTAGALLDVTVHDGVPELLTALGGDGALLAVATSKPEPFARRVRHKDEVVGLALAAHPDGRAPVLVGDRAHDVLGAAAHGLPCLGAGWGPAPPGELADAGAVAVVPTPADLPAALDVACRGRHA
jgi:phosphoglycolate phosphatase